MKLLQLENKKNQKLFYVDTLSAYKKQKEGKKEIMQIVCFLGTISTSKV